MIGGEFTFDGAAWLPIGMQMAGLVSALLARLYEAGAHGVWWHRLFFGCMGLVGAATMTAIMLGTTQWLPWGATFAAMSVSAVLDFGPPTREVL
jgi:hypothetical protein